jgi:DNA-binding NarL/FixJ family response regulator
MKLEYSVLWFDNDPDLFDSLEDEIEDMRNQISNWGFIPNVKLVIDPEEFSQSWRTSEFDLVVVDFNLEQHGQGQDFIREIRSKQVFTEVIFYSAQAASELWQAVRDRELEGVYIANKENVVPRILVIGRHTLRKVLDLANMRGIVMAEVGDLDLLLEEILSLAIGGVSPDVQKIVFDRFHKDATRHLTQLQAGLKDFAEAPSIDGLLKLCDSDKRWSNFDRIRARHEFLKGHTFGDYRADVLRPRNFLAHGIPTKLEDGTLRFTYGESEFDFNDQVGEVLRKAIIRYREMFTEIKDALSA